MNEYYFFFLIQYGGIDQYNYKWRPLKNFDAIISSVSCQIYMYHLQQLNQSIYLPQYLPFNYKEIQPSKLETKNILMIGRISSEKQYIIQKIYFFLLPSPPLFPDDPIPCCI